MVHFSSIRLPPCEMERQDPVRAEVPPALPVLIPGLAHFLVVGLTDLFCQLGSNLPLPPSVHQHPLGGWSLWDDTPQCGECSQWDDTPPCGERSQWDAHLRVESAPSGMRTSVESAPSGMRASVWRALPVGCAPQCGECSHWDARLCVESSPSGMHASVESAPNLAGI